jgi:hypothetical protein
VCDVKPELDTSAARGESLLLAHVRALTCDGPVESAQARLDDSVGEVLASLLVRALSRELGASRTTLRV